MFAAFSTPVNVSLRYELKVDTDHKVEMKPELVMRAKDGIKLYLQPRAWEDWLLGIIISMQL